MPALAAGLSACGSWTSAPSVPFKPRPSAISVVTGWICTPIHPRLTVPLSLSWATTDFTASAGMSNAMPTDPPDGEKIAVLTPMTLPSRSKVGATGIALVNRCVDLDKVVIGAGTNVASAS